MLIGGGAAVGAGVVKIIKLDRKRKFYFDEVPPQCGYDHHQPTVTNWNLCDGSS